MDVSLVINEMQRQHLLDWNDNTSIINKDNADWTQLIVRHGTKPPLSTANAIWLEIEDSVLANQANISAKQALSDGAVTSKSSWALIKAFNDALESVFESFGSITTQEYFDLGYTSWRTLYDNLPLEMQGRIQGFNTLFQNPSDNFSFTEPQSVNNGYKTEFMNRIRDFLEYITDRASI